MPLFAMPLILNIEADSLADAQEAIEMWGEDLELDSCPEGTESFDIAPACDTVDGQRVVFLPSEDEFSMDEDSDDEEDNEEDDDYEELDSDEI